MCETECSWENDCGTLMPQPQDEIRRSVTALNYFEDCPPKTTLESAVQWCRRSIQTYNAFTAAPAPRLRQLPRLPLYLDLKRLHVWPWKLPLSGGRYLAVASRNYP